MIKTLTTSMPLIITSFLILLFFWIPLRERGVSFRVNKGLITLLIVLAVIAAIFGGFKWLSKSSQVGDNQSTVSATQKSLPPAPWAIASCSPKEEFSSREIIFRRIVVLQPGQTSQPLTCTPPFWQAGEKEAGWKRRWQLRYGQAEVTAWLNGQCLHTRRGEELTPDDIPPTSGSFTVRVKLIDDGVIDRQAEVPVEFVYFRELPGAVEPVRAQPAAEQVTPATPEVASASSVVQGPTPEISPEVISASPEVWNETPEVSPEVESASREQEPVAKPVPYKIPK